jgi:hypothetical protein
MLRRGDTRLAVVLVTGVLLGDFWSWGAGWLGKVLNPWSSVVESACDDGPMIDPNGQPRPNAGLMIDPNGSSVEPRSQPLSDQGLMIDPDGSSVEPNNQPRRDQGPMVDPNG